MANPHDISAWAKGVPSRRDLSPKGPEDRLEFNALVKEFSETSNNEARMKVTAKYYKLLESDNNFEKCFKQVKDKTDFKSEEKSKEFLLQGTKALRSGNKEKAHEMYTKAIAHAPLDSVRLARGYSNRSGVLYSMGRCKESLEDTRRALSHKYCNSKKIRLHTLEIQCHRDLGNMKEAHRCLDITFYMLQYHYGLTAEKIAAEKEKLLSELMAPSMETCNEVIILPDKVPDLSYGPSSEVLGASSAVRMEYNGQLGPHLVANRDIRIGDVLLIGENVAGAVRDKHMHDHCSHCHKLCLNLLPCQNCAMMMFCSEQCQSEATKKYHLTECAVFSRFCHVHKYFNCYNLVIRLIATIGIDNVQPYLKYARGNTEDNLFDSHGLFDSSDIESLFKLDCMIGKRDPQEMLKTSLFSFLIPRCFGMEFEDPAYCAVAGLCLQLHDTAYMKRYTKSYMNFNIMEERDMNPVIYFNTLASLKKHACHGNLYSVPYGCKLVSRAKHPISEGSVLTECFDLSLLKRSKVERQQILKTVLLLDCKCEGCENNWDFDEDLEFISDPDDELQVDELLDLYEDRIWDVLCRNLPSNQMVAIFQSFLENATDILTKLYDKGEFRDHRCGDVRALVCLYYRLQGNRAVYPHSGLKPYHTENTDYGPTNSAVRR